jgi:hypothetical protein
VWLATCARRSRCPLLAGIPTGADLVDPAGLEVVQAAKRSRGHGEWAGGWMSSDAHVWAQGPRQRRELCPTLEARWTGRVAVAARSWPWSVRCSGPSSGWPRAGAGGRRNQQGGGRTRTRTRGGVGHDPAREPALNIPSGWRWERNRWRRFPEPARRLARPTRQPAWQRRQARQRRPGQARQQQARQGQGRQVAPPTAPNPCRPCWTKIGMAEQLAWGRPRAGDLVTCCPHG